MKLLLSIAALILACSSSVFASSPSQRARGAIVFKASGCQYCHTINRVGGQRGPDLSDVGKRKSEAAIRRQIIYGSKVMPPFGDILKPEEFKDLIAYLRSCRETPIKQAQTTGSM
jgi:mono/diheme cytochrome c family protein